MTYDDRDDVIWLTCIERFGCKPAANAVEADQRASAISVLNAERAAMPHERLADGIGALRVFGSQLIEQIGVWLRILGASSNRLGEVMMFLHPSACRASLSTPDNE